MEAEANIPEPQKYPARLQIEYPEKLDPLTTFFRWLLVIPISIVLALVSGGGLNFINSTTVTNAGEFISRTQETSTEVAGGLFIATALMIAFAQRYPRWWFDFNLELTRFATRVAAYGLLLTDEYPSTEEAQSVHLHIDYPDVKNDLNQWLPFVKWFLAIPHYFFLAVLSFVAAFGVIIAWFAILFTGQYPRGIFDLVVGLMRWSLRVQAYAVLLVTDEYPPFSLD